MARLSAVTSAIAAASLDPTWAGLAISAQYMMQIGVLMAVLVVTVAIRQHAWTLYCLFGVLGCVWSAMNEQGAAAVFIEGFVIPVPIYVTVTHVTASASFAVAAMACPPDGWRGSPKWVFLWCAGISFALAGLGVLLPRDTAIALAVGLLGLGGVSRVFAVGLSNLLFVTGALPSGVETAVMGRWVLTLAILFGGAVCLIRVFELQRDREQKLVEVAMAAKREAATNQALLVAERNYAEAREVARNRSEDLARASHDIKQPLISLRRNLDIVGRREPEHVRRRLRDAFDYLDHLTDSYLLKSAPDNGRIQEPERNPPTPVGTLLETIDRMFRQEAEAKGLHLEVRPSAAQLSAPPLIVMRVLSNLVSNAIRHTEKGKVAIEAEDTQGTVVIVVRNSHNDAQNIDFERFFEPGNKGETSAGSGLGLAIAREQANSIGMSLTVDIAADSETPVIFRLSETGTEQVFPTKP